MCEALEHMVKAAWTKWSRESQKNNIEKNFVICSLFFPLQGSRLSHSRNHCFENHCELLFSILISDRLDRNKTQQIEKNSKSTLSTKRLHYSLLFCIISYAMTKKKEIWWLYFHHICSLLYFWHILHCPYLDLKLLNLIESSVIGPKILTWKCILHREVGEI